LGCLYCTTTNRQGRWQTDMTVRHFPSPFRATESIFLFRYNQVGKQLGIHQLEEVLLECQRRINSLHATQLRAMAAIAARDGGE
jgi:hypothetical protein